MLIFVLPLIIIFSLCYAATRHEEMHLILHHAARFGGWLTFFILIAIVVLESLHWLNGNVKF